MIIRRAINSRFTVLPNAVAQDLRLSIEARGGIAYLLSLPGDWEVDLDHLGRAFRTGRDKTRGIVNELIANGYVVRQRKHAPGGTFDGFEYVIFDDPAAARAAFPEAFEAVDSPQTENTSLVEPAAALPAPDFQALAYKKETKNLQKQKLREARASGEAQAEGVSCDSDVLFVSFMDRWPIKTGNRQKAFASWSRLSEGDRKRALEGVDAYRVACKAEGRKYLCAAHTYLDDAPWRRLGGDTAAAPSGPVSMVAPFTRTWWQVFHVRRAAGQPVRNMVAAAAEGRGYAVPNATLPTIADEQRLRQVATDSDQWRAYADELDSAGVRLPELTTPYAWLPSDEAETGERTEADAAETVTAASREEVDGERPASEATTASAQGATPSSPQEFVSRDADPYLFGRLAARYERERGRPLRAIRERGIEQGWDFPASWIADAKRGGLDVNGLAILPDTSVLSDEQKRALHGVRAELKGWRPGSPLPLRRPPAATLHLVPREASHALRLAS